MLGCTGEQKTEALCFLWSQQVKLRTVLLLLPPISVNCSIWKEIMPIILQLFWRACHLETTLQLMLGPIKRINPATPFCHSSLLCHNALFNTSVLDCNSQVTSHYKLFLVKLPRFWKGQSSDLCVLDSLQNSKRYCSTTEQQTNATQIHAYHDITNHILEKQVCLSSIASNRPRLHPTLG